MRLLSFFIIYLFLSVLHNLRTIILSFSLSLVYIYYIFWQFIPCIYISIFLFFTRLSLYISLRLFLTLCLSSFLYLSLSVSLFLSFSLSNLSNLSLYLSIYLSLLSLIQVLRCRNMDEFLGISERLATIRALLGPNAGLLSSSNSSSSSAVGKNTSHSSDSSSSLQPVSSSSTLLPLLSSSSSSSSPHQSYMRAGINGPGSSNSTLPEDRELSVSGHLLIFLPSFSPSCLFLFHFLFFCFLPFPRYSVPVCFSSSSSLHSFICFLASSFIHIMKISF